MWRSRPRSLPLVELLEPGGEGGGVGRDAVIVFKLNQSAIKASL